VKDQELNPRPHTLRPAALPVKVEQWVNADSDNILPQKRLYLGLP